MLFGSCHLWPGNGSLPAVSCAPLLYFSEVLILILSLLFKTLDLLCALLLLCICCSLFYTAFLQPNYFSQFLPFLHVFFEMTLLLKVCPAPLIVPSFLLYDFYRPVLSTY